MSYTPSEQLLTAPIEKTLAGIAEIDAAILARLKDRGEWLEGHLDEILTLSIDLRRLHARLLKLSSETR